MLVHAHAGAVHAEPQAHVAEDARFELAIVAPTRFPELLIGIRLGTRVTRPGLPRRVAGACAPGGRRPGRKVAKELPRSLLGGALAQVRNIEPVAGH